jgi:hypothetical protein
MEKLQLRVLTRRLNPLSFIPFLSIQAQCGLHKRKKEAVDGLGEHN